MAATSDSLRLFYALWPDDATRAALQKLQMRVRGRHMRYENLHITLAFLGQQTVAQLPLLKKILADLPRCDIALSIDRLGYFKKPRIAWAGTHAVPDALTMLQNALVQALEQHGIVFDRHNHFKPHITLARDAEPPDDAPFEVVTWHARQSVLVQSMQSGGGLAYRVLAARGLAEPG
jgi:2'-5' RNA ligase